MYTPGLLIMNKSACLQAVISVTALCPNRPFCTGNYGSPIRLSKLDRMKMAFEGISVALHTLGITEACPST